MAPPSERSHLPYTAGRRSMYAARQTQYSSLGGALGSARQPQYAAGSDYPPPASVSGGSVSQHPHIATDARTYYSPSALPSYEYPYQSTTYETSAQYGHSSLPPMRTTSPVAHTSHPTSHYNPPTASYPSSYSQAQYATIPSVAQQWPEDDWAQPPQSFSPDHLQPMFVAGRSDLAASPQTDTRPYVPPQYASAPGGVRPDEWSAYPSEFSPTSKGKARERELAFSDRSSPPNAFRPISTDYSKLMSTYGQLVGECKEITQQGVLGRPASLDDIECMLRSATLGLQMLQPSSSPVAAQNRNPSEDSTAEQGTQSPESPSKRQAENAPAPEGQKCLGCGATSTPEWRRGPLGPRTLCNACGLVYAKLIKKRSQELGPNSIIAPTQPQLHSAPVPAISEEAPSFSSPNNGDSDDDELSYGSQDPH